MPQLRACLLRCRFGRSSFRLIVTALLTLLAGSAAHAVTTTVVAGGFTMPIDIVNAGDGSNRVFVAEQGGSVWILNGGQRIATPFLDIAPLVVCCGERGLLGLAFHPQFRTNGRLYVDYPRRGDGATVIAEYRVGSDAQRVDPTTARTLLVIPQPFETHNGGALRFGPDGFLYLGMGDGGSGNDPGNRAQDRNELLGKILRIDVDRGTPYAIPATNPFASGVGGRPEIFAVGVRNPWRFAFDRATGDFYLGDVGQGAWEEIDRLPAGTGAGANLGWRIMEGRHCTGLSGTASCNDPTLVPPIVEYDHGAGNCSVTGGTVYRGPSVPALAGRYVYADYCTGRVWSAAPDRTGIWRVRDVLGNGSPVSVFGEDERGELYFADYGRGQVRGFVAEPGDRADAVEYYHAVLDHYFITAAPSDINALDARMLAGWQRTGESFGTFTSAQAGVNEACRFYIPPALGDSHFISASPVECAEVRQKFPALVEERPTYMAESLPDAVTGACPAGRVPVYRVWNARADSNHRYTTQRAIRDEMVARGGIAEGYGPEAVALCAPA
jgi:glucose/arabinose dehydrogenase